MCRVELKTKTWIPQFIRLLQDCHRHCGEPHRPDQQQLGQVEAVQPPLRLSQPVEDAKPEK